MHAMWGACSYNGFDTIFADILFQKSNGGLDPKDSGIGNKAISSYPNGQPCKSVGRMALEGGKTNAEVGFPPCEKSK